MRFLTADYLFPISQPPIKEGVLTLNDMGKIIDISSSRSHFSSEQLEIYDGILAPGFINTHCHLELSHMKGKVQTGTTLIPFITNVVQKRAASAQTIQNAIRRAEVEMLKNGIVAVGDISNVTDTFAQKAKGNMRYYTFVEMFDFLQDAAADAEFEKYNAVFEALQPPNPNNYPLSIVNYQFKSRVPHAPYSVSKKLFQKINAANPQKGITVSIHNQETVPENELFLYGTGAFREFYGKFGIALDDFKHNQKTAIHYAIENMNPDNRTLFVHNTLTTKADIEAAHAFSPNVYWATCPNANLYIENRLPNYQHFLDTDARLTIGTDSLTSNWQLSILEEMKTIARFQSYISFERMLKWATLNGAQALGFEETLGSFEVGKTPGINLIENIGADFQLKAGAKVRKL
jgi:aminodeoxyfutalosine deaminase